MMDLVLKRPVAVLIFYLIALAFGGFAIRHIQVDLMPDVEEPKINVITDWPHATPETVQKDVNTPIEAIAGRIPGVAEVRSESRYGNSTVTITFEKDAHMDYAQFQLKEELAVLRGTLPRQVSGPQVRTILPDEMRTRQQDFFEVQVSAGMPLQDVRTFVRREVVPRLAAIDGISDVTIRGGSDRVAKVLLDRERLQYLDIRSETVANRLMDLRLKYAAEPLVKDDLRIELLVDNSVLNAEQLARIPIISRGDRVIRLSDVASVSMGYGTLYSLSRVNGLATVTLSLEKTQGANTIETARACRQLIDQLGDRFPDLSFRVLEDSGEDIEDQVMGLAKRAGFIVILVLASLMLFLLSFRTPLVIVATILLSSLLAVDLFYLFDLSINFISLSGLALGFGMMVDNAIVVAESIIAHLDTGKSRETAVRTGTREVAGSIVASTLTTIGGFFAFVFLSGRLAAYYMPLALAIVFSLSASLLVAFTLIPLAYAKTGLRTRPRALLHFRFMSRPLAWVRKLAPLVIALVLLLGWQSYRTFSKEVSTGGFFYRPDPRTVSVYIRMPGEADVSTIDDILLPFERRAVDRTGVKDVVLNVYRNSGHMRVSFTDEAKQTAFPFLIKDELIAVGSELAGITVGVSGLDQNGYYSSPGGGGRYMNSRLTITGFSYDQVKLEANRIRRQVLRERRVQESEVVFSQQWYGGDDEEIVIRMRQDMIRRNGISISELVGYISRNLQTELGSRVRMEGEEMELEIRFHDFRGLTREELLGVTFRSAAGQWIRLGDLVTFDRIQMGSSITKKNQKYLAQLAWNYRGSSKRARAFNRKVYEELTLPPGFTKEMDESYMTESEEQMIYRAYIIALIVIYLLLAAYFESLILPLPVLLSVPFAVIGVFQIFVHGGYSFDSSAYMGLILLFGIVVNNAILYVDHYRHDPDHDPVNASLRRVRPVLLTTLTTVVGMLPLVLETSGESETQQVWVSLGISTIGGLISSSILIICCMPAFMVAFEQIRKLGGRMKLAWLAGWRKPSARI